MPTTPCSRVLSIISLWRYFGTTGGMVKFRFAEVCALPLHAHVLMLLISFVAVLVLCDQEEREARLAEKRMERIARQEHAKRDRMERARQYQAQVDAARNELGALRQERKSYVMGRSRDTTIPRDLFLRFPPLVCGEGEGSPFT